MVNLLIEVSRYLMILLAAGYTYCNFRFFSVKDSLKQKKLFCCQNGAMFSIHFLAYLIIWSQTKDGRAPLFYLAQAAFFLGYQLLYGRSYPQWSSLLGNNLCMLLCVGFVMLTRLSFDRAVKQFVLVLISALSTWLIPFVIRRAWQLSRIPWVYGIGGLFLLLLVRLGGKDSYGALLSLNFGSYSVQPSEFVKISFVFFVAAMFYRSLSFRTVALTTLIAALHVLVLTASRDLGGALLFFITYVFMLFVATGKWLVLLAGSAGAALSSVLAYFLFGHVRTRVTAWQNPWADIAGRGYQITQSLFAIGTGGWFGLGLYRGMPGKIPVVEKDFIFSAVSEEMGGIFALCILLVCLGCFVQFMMIASRMQAVFYKLTAFGLGTMYMIQVFLNVGGVTKFIPSTGVTLPLISYGGSSVLSTFVMFGVMQGLYVLKRREEESDEQ